jgi:sec-independent protein translocase protein TatC
MPVILWQLWRFVTPALYPHEKRYAVPFTISAMVLFLLGATIAYLSLVPTIKFLQDFAGSQVVQIPTVDSYLKLNLFMMLAFGAGFEFPVLLVALQLVGVLSPRKLLGWWRYATVLITVVAAVITPSGDPISMLALAIPMEILYFVSIGIGAVVARRTRSGTPAPP